MTSTKKLLIYAEKLALGLALEVSAFPKPGNVHRLRNFEDIIYEDFIVAAMLAIEPLYRGIKRGYKYDNNLNKLNVIYGDIVYETVKLSMTVSGGGNTCLGSTLLLSPLSVALGKAIASVYETNLSIEYILKDACDLFREYSTVLDAVYFYRAVRATNPSYIRKSDITGDFPNVWSKRYKLELIERRLRLWDIIEYSSNYDIVAKEIIDCYSRSYTLSRYILSRLKHHGVWNRAVVEAYLYQLSKELDTLIVRKNGIEVAQKVKEKAEVILRLCEKSWGECFEKLRMFDEELASLKVNPGSTADIVAVAISIYSLFTKKDLLRLRKVATNE
ncbi:MAG: triphosphoribosyl-dephospho-CoA synthase [Ignisphaera sp.]